MSKERELLNKAIEMIQIVPLMASIGHAAPDFGSELILEIQELLAQPEQTEQEPVAWMNDSGGCFLSDGNKYSEHWTALYTAPPNSTRAEQLAFEEGIIFAEISYGIGGGE